jgi:hypothetical protein
MRNRCAGARDRTSAAVKQSVIHLQKTTGGKETGMPFFSWISKSFQEKQMQSLRGLTQSRT